MIGFVGKTNINTIKESIKKLESKDQLNDIEKMSLRLLKDTLKKVEGERT